MAGPKTTAVTLEYGLGKACTAELEEQALDGVSAHDLITMVVETPQETEPARRTAKMVSSAIHNRHPLDVEVVRGSNRSKGEPGDPIELDDPVINRESCSQKTENLTLRVSEPYVGG